MFALTTRIILLESTVGVADVTLLRPALLLCWSTALVFDAKFWAVHGCKGTLQKPQCLALQHLTGEAFMSKMVSRLLASNWGKVPSSTPKLTRKRPSSKPP